MTIGQQTLSQQTINNVLGSWAAQLRTMFSQAAVLKTTLDAINTTGLQALGFSAADATAVINAYNDIVNLGAVYYGNSYVAFGATVNQGVVTANSAGHFGYNFDITIGQKCAGIGF